MINETINKKYGSLSFIEAVTIFPWKMVRLFNSILKSRGYSFRDRYSEKPSWQEQEKSAGKEFKRDVNGTSNNPWIKGRMSLSIQNKDGEDAGIQFSDRVTDSSYIQVSFFTVKARSIKNIRATGSAEYVFNQIIDEIESLLGKEGDHFNDVNELLPIEPILKRFEILFKKSFLAFEDSDYNGKHKARANRSKEVGALEDSAYVTYSLYIQLDYESFGEGRSALHGDDASETLFKYNIKQNFKQMIDIIHSRGYKILNTHYSNRGDFTITIIAAEYDRHISDGMFSTRTVKESEDKAISEITKIVKDASEKKIKGIYKKIMEGVFSK